MGLKYNFHNFEFNAFKILRSFWKTFLFFLMIAILISINSNLVFSANCGGDVNCNCSDVLNQSYILNSNLTCNNNGIFAKDFSVDCNGFSIIGNGTGSGITVEGALGANILNCQIINFTKGVELKPVQRARGQGWGGIIKVWWEDPRNTKIFNNSFIKNQFGVYSKDGFSDEIFNNEFINNSLFGVYLDSKSSTIWNNSFYNTSVFYTNTAGTNLCKSGFLNKYFQGAKSFSCSCFEPMPNLNVNSNARFCKSNYNITSPMVLTGQIDCQGSKLQGNLGTGFIVKGFSNGKIENCIFNNFSTAINLKSQIVTQGLGWGVLKSKEILTKLMEIRNNIFQDNLKAIVSKNSLSSNIIFNQFTDNSFALDLDKTSTVSISANLFENSSIKTTATRDKYFCLNNISNLYWNGTNGSNCSCTIPEDGLIVNSKVLFCSGEYFLPNGITIENGGSIVCNETSLIGNMVGIGITVKGARNSQINSCKISNYSTGISYNPFVYYSNYKWFTLTSNFNNSIINSKLENLNMGVSMSSNGIHGDNYARNISNTVFLSNGFNIFNDINSQVFARNNFWNLTNISSIESKFFKPQLINYTPFQDNLFFNLINSSTNISNNFDFELDSKFVFYDGKNLNLKIIKPYFALDLLEIEVFKIVSGEVTQSRLFEVSSYFTSEILVNLTLNLAEGEEIRIVLDPNNKLNEKFKFNNILKKKIKLPRKIFINMNTSSKVLSVELNNYFQKSLGNQIVHNKSLANIIISITDNSFKGSNIFEVNNFNKNINLWFNSKANLKPYEGFVSSTITNNISYIEIFGEDIEGVIVGTNYFMENMDLFFNLEKFSKINQTNLEGIRIYDIMHNLQNSVFYKQELDKFAKIIRETLNKNFYIYTNYNVEVNSEFGVLNYSLKEISSKSSQKFLNYFNQSSNPILIGGGLWSNINAGKLMGENLVDNGKKVFLIEITGSSLLECNTCFNYNFSHLITNVFPKFILKVLNLTGASQVDYVGHSNGGRTGLVSLEKGFIQNNTINKFVAIGVPGAFDGKSILKSIVLDHGKDLNKNILDLNHISIFDIVFFGYLPENKNAGSSKISKNLWLDYYNWIVNTSDLQPGINLSLNEFHMISGNILKKNNDGIVEVLDQNKIFDNINANLKTKKTFNIVHFNMLENLNVIKRVEEVLLN